MANALMLHYASNRANRENGERGGMQSNRNEMYGGMQNNRMEYGGMRNTYEQYGMARSTGGDMRQPNQYITRNEYEGGAESRYRGKAGQSVAGRPRCCTEQSGDVLQVHRKAPLKKAPPDGGAVLCYRTRNETTLMPKALAIIIRLRSSGMTEPDSQALREVLRFAPSTR